MELFFISNLVQLAACESVFQEIIAGCKNIIKLTSVSKGIVLNTCLQGDLFLSQNNRGRRAERDVWVFGIVTTRNPLGVETCNSRSMLVNIRFDHIWKP